MAPKLQAKQAQQAQQAQQHVQQAQQEVRTKHKSNFVQSALAARGIGFPSLVAPPPPLRG